MPASLLQRPPLLSLALASGVALAYEILLVRLFSISYWHHYAYMIISLALLGYGMSGAFLALLRRPLLQRFAAAYLVNLLLFSVSLIISYRLAARTGFNPQEIFWDPRQWLRLTAIYFYLALPFFFVANAIGLALMQFRNDTAQVYGADLLGAGAGSTGIVILLLVLFPDHALRLLAVLGSLAAWICALQLRPRRLPWMVLPLLVALLLGLLPASWTEVRMSPYKDLEQTLQISGTHIVQRASGPLGLVDVTDNQRIPLRHAPGLSLYSPHGPPEQLAVFVDGDGPSAITRGDRPAALAYLDQLSWALPYHLRKPARVLVLGAGGGSEVLQARYLGAGQIDAVELNPQVSALLRERYAAFSGQLYSSADVQLFNAEARGYIATTAHRYDLIQVALVDSFGASAAGLYALSESYLYTTEALQSYLQRLTPDGYLAISRWIKLPVRDTPKLFATAITALQQLGIDQPGAHLVLIRSWQTSTLLIKNSAFTATELDAVKAFCRTRGFDLSYYSGIQPDEVNRYNVMPEPWLYQAALALLGSDRERFIAAYKFNLQPASDDRPYFFHFFKWNALPEIFALLHQGGMPLLDTAYLVLVATLLQALLASLVLILLPLWVYRRSAVTEAPLGRRRVLIYFTALGLAFLLLEIAFIQKFILFLHHPVYAVAVVLTGFLLFAGAGSAWSRRLHPGRATITVPVAIIAGLSLLYLVILDGLFTTLATLDTPWRILLSLALIAPLAFCMGLPFPIGVARLARSAPHQIPWAWGINGCASVVSAVLATLLAMHFGFKAVVLTALLLYVAAAKNLPD